MNSYMVPILFNCDIHMCIYIVDNDIKLILKVSLNCGVEVCAGNDLGGPFVN